ncbi:MAG: T9SS type A sorting domain-containing protein [Flavobacteriales bacterium]|nr:T9SS type A sorting domain-containing protein [Flavobacteriales bacterium]
MRKIYFTMGVMLLSTLTVFAQRESVNLGRVDFNEFELGSRTPTDTLWPGDFDSGTPTLFGASNGGYVVGNNGYFDEAKGQVFISNATIVEGALFFFGAKDDGGNGSNVVAELRAFDGTTGTTSVGAGQQCPGTLLSSVNIALADVDTSGAFTAATFSAPQYVNGDFYVGFNVAGLASGDTVGLVSTDDGEGNGAELTWELWQGGTDWYTMVAAWPLDFDFGIWAVVDNSSNGIEDESYFNGIKADCYPNPSVDVANIVFDLENASKVSLEIYSLSGQKVYNVDKGQLSQGQHTLNIPVSEFGSGTYYYSLNADGNRLTKKMVVK